MIFRVSILINAPNMHSASLFVEQNFHPRSEVDDRAWKLMRPVIEQIALAMDVVEQERFEE
jgi:hypothetical protein